jgi:hypothetical protein
MTDVKLGGKEGDGIRSSGESVVSARRVVSCYSRGYLDASKSCGFVDGTEFWFRIGRRIADLTIKARRIGLEKSHFLASYIY